ncbi:MAG: DNA-directed RNA polymerase subunit alpha [Negativicutes bacterium]|nr:DNA-directed RNA polymerase subunit alpha [Negativicutes bacterium]
MKENACPEIRIVEISEDNRYGRFEWEPLERGYGMTLGNSLRRVLLSSLPGAAVVAIKIDGVMHEFSTVPGVREDVADIVLNIKQLCLRWHDEDGEGTKIARINFSGEGVVTGGDVKTDAGLEVLNKDLPIATLAAGAQLNMELYVRRGVGYVTSDKNKQYADDIGMIPVDAVYSPILRVNYTVTDTRVGNVTNYDRLTFELWTNGGITPDEAVVRAAGIIIGYFRQLDTITGKVIAKRAEMAQRAGMKDGREGDGEAGTDGDGHHDLTLEEMELSVRAYNSLKRAEINRLSDITKMTAEELMKVKNLGPKSRDEVLKKIQEYGLKLADD